MNRFVTAQVAIDTNVFVFLLNDQENTNQHIDDLLSRLMSDQVRLCVDDKNRIAKEYLKHVQPLFKKASETGIRLQILRYWMNQDAWHRNEVIEMQGPEMKALEGVLPGHGNRNDRIFIIVACKYKTKLITNDKSDIIVNRTALRRAISRWRTAATDFHTSTDVVAML